MKKLSLLLILNLNLVFLSLAEEGMWIPSLLKALNEADMQKMGSKLSADEIYNINKSSLKDAVLQFGGGCTGEMISGEGLLLTNHHCGYGQIQSHSSVERDYLTNGFWAMNKKDELPCKGLTAMFIIRIVDVTSKILEEVTADISETKRDSIIQARSKKWKRIPQMERITTRVCVRSTMEMKCTILLEKKFIRQWSVVSRLRLI